MNTKFLFFSLFVGIVGNPIILKAQTLSASPSSIAKTASGSQTVNLNVSSWGGSTKSWSVAPAGPTFGSATTNNSTDNTLLIGPSVMPGTYTVKATQTTSPFTVRTVTVMVQDPSLTADMTAITIPVGTNTIAVALATTNWSGTKTWSVSPGTGASLSGSGNDTRTLTFSGAATAGNYTVTATDGFVTKTVIIKASVSNFWAAYNTDNGTHQAHAFSISGGVYSSGPTTLFSVGSSYAALGRGPYPSVPTGYFYWIPNNGTNGVFSMYARSGDGSGSDVTIVNNFDVNGAGDNTTLGFVRLGTDKNGVNWIVASDGTTVYLVKVATDVNPFTTATATVVDNNVTLAGGTAATFQNGDVCLDGNGRLYVLVNDGSGSTQIFMGMPNGSSTTLTKQWNVLDINGNAFGGSVNGNCFDQFGGMYLSVNGNGTNNDPKDGIYYLDPATIANSPAGSTIKAKPVYVASGYADLGTNVWPVSTPLPVTFGSITVTKQSGQVVVNWQTSSETNCKEFVVEASKDGKDWTAIGKLDSKSINGNSSQPIDYSLTLSLPGSLAALGLGGLLLLSIGGSRWLRALILVIIMAAVASCVKDSKLVNADNNETVYVRIAQYGKGGEVQYSKVVTVVNN